MEDIIVFLTCEMCLFRKSMKCEGPLVEENTQFKINSFQKTKTMSSNITHTLPLRIAFDYIMHANSL